MNKFLKILAIALVLGMTATALFSCGDEEKDEETGADTQTEIPYETLDDDGWSPIWRP